MHARAGRPVCVGSGVPGDIWEHGHVVLPGTERAMFAVKQRVLGKTYFPNRCRYCSSTRYNARREDCKQKAVTSHRKHASKMVEKGLAPTRADAVRIMNGAGFSPEFVAEMLRVALGQECPGMCGWPTRHRITQFPDLQLDWRDPRFPLTPENAGPLCANCNQQKGETPWAEFIARQHAIRMNLDQVCPLPPPPVQQALW